MPPEAPAPESPRTTTRPALKASSELGTLDPQAVKKAFAALDGPFMDCQKQALDRVEVLSGSVKFFLRITEDGSAKYTFLEDSEIGDRDTEKCLHDVVMAARWPKPEGGGEAEARYGMDLPLQSTRPPNDWNADKVAASLGKQGSAIDRCKGSVNAKFRATMYVGPGGKVLAAGVAASSLEGTEKLECLTGVLLKLKGLPSPGSWPAKVTFGI
jgi:hypothetical protein